MCAYIIDKKEIIKHFDVSGLLNFRLRSKQAHQNPSNQSVRSKLTTTISYYTLGMTNIYTYISFPFPSSHPVSVLCSEQPRRERERERERDGLESVV